MIARTVGVIDDDRLVRATLKAILEDAGYRVVTAADGKHAADVIQDQDVEIIITDLLMPDRNGFDTIREIRRQRPNMKMMVVSGAIPAGGASLIDMVGSLGANRVLAKPVPPDQLIGAVEDLLSQ